MCAVLAAVSSRRRRKIDGPLNWRKANMDVFGADTAVPLDQGECVCFSYTIKKPHKLYRM